MLLLLLLLLLNISSKTKEDMVKDLAVVKEEATTDQETGFVQNVINTTL